MEEIPTDFQEFGQVDGAMHNLAQGSNDLVEFPDLVDGAMHNLPEHSNDLVDGAMHNLGSIS